jgi:hypothetical protein
MAGRGTGMGRDRWRVVDDSILLSMVVGRLVEYLCLSQGIVHRD